MPRSLEAPRVLTAPAQRSGAAPELTQADRERLAAAMARLLAAWWRQQQGGEQR